MTPTARRGMVQQIQRDFGYSQRRSCRLVGVGRSTARYQGHRASDEAFRERLRDLAQRRVRHGYRFLHDALVREVWAVNHKRVYRLYRQDRLALRRRRRKRPSLLRAAPRTPPTGVNQRWSMDFLVDALADGRRFRVLSVIEDHTRECLVLEVDTSLPGDRVVEVMGQLGQRRGIPEVITVDNGPEFTGRAMDRWAYAAGVKLHFIDPGKPVQNALVESFQGRLRDECLNTHWFISIADARRTIEAWRREHNEQRPHGSLGRMSPAAFAATEQLRQITRAAAIVVT